MVEEIKGKIEEVDEKGKRAKIAGQWVAFTEKAFGFVKNFPKGETVSVKLGHGGEAYFIEAIEKDIGAYVDRAPAKASRKTEEDFFPGQFRPIGKELMKACLLASVENWKVLIGTLDKPGPYFEQVGPLDKVIVFEQIVATAQSMFISATKMSY